MSPRVRAALANRRVVAGLQLTFVVVLLAVLGWALRDVWGDAAPRLRDASLTDLGIALVVLGAYYLVFVLGWMRILSAYGIRVRYAVALQAEMLSMLAKYVPGGVWTPAARVVALRRHGVKDTPVVLATVLLEAGLSAIAGVAVFLAGLVFVDAVDVPLLPLLAFAAVVGVLLYPPVFRAVARRLLRPFGAQDVAPLRARIALELLAFYAVTWPLGGVALFFLLRSVGADPPLAAIPFLGGASAVGAIVAVLSVFAPSGLGVREASVYGLILAVASEGAALGAVVLNRLAITAVEAALLLAGVAALRGTSIAEVEAEAEAELLPQSAQA